MPTALSKLQTSRTLIYRLLFNLYVRIGNRIRGIRHEGDEIGHLGSIDWRGQWLQDNIAISVWALCGRPAPPPHALKVRCVRGFQKRLGISVFIETGTYMGDMVRATRDVFEDIYSIELGSQLAERAMRLFADNSHIHILQGDSGDVLHALLSSVLHPCLFWLDGHYTDDTSAKGPLVTPILSELEAIKKHSVKSDAILIDDARCFSGKDGWPRLDEMSGLLRAVNPDFIVETKDDIIRAYVAEVHGHEQVARL